MNKAVNSTEWSLSDNEVLADEISILAAQIHAATYRFLVLVREFDSREAWAELGLKSCAHWMNWRCGISLHTGREKVRVAHALTDLVKISAAFERGQLSYSKVRAVTRVANIDNEDMLLNIALSGTAAQLERLVRCEIRMTSEEEVEASTQQAFENRYFSWQEQSDGSVSFQGSLPAELAAKVIAAIESFESVESVESGESVESFESGESVESGRSGASGVSGASSASGVSGASGESGASGALGVSGESDESGASVESDASVESGASVESDASGASEAFGESGKSFELIEQKPVSSIDERKELGVINCVTGEKKNVPAETPAAIAATVGARRADALVALLESSFGGYQVMLHVPAGSSARPVTLDPGGTIPYAAAERICCDASIVPVVEDESGKLLDIGRKTRKIPPALRRALGLRDKNTCRFPGCTHTRYLHGHHIEHWAHGGKTCLDNLVLLCSHHHGLVHEGGFGCRAVRRAGVKGVCIVFARKDGVELPAAFQLESSSSHIEADQERFNIHAQTSSASDFGQALDIGIVVDAMQYIRNQGRQENGAKGIDQDV